MDTPLFNEEMLRLIAITDEIDADASALIDRCSAAVRGGATMVQLRLKNADARTLLEVARRLVRAVPVPVVVNDRADVAIVAGAAGVHLGAEDVPVAAIRKIAPPGFIIGASVGGDDEVANSAEADYVGIGPAFSTRTKKDAGNAIGTAEIARLAAKCGKPAVAIGGIDAANVDGLRNARVSGVAVVRSLFGTADPERVARQLRGIVGGWGGT